MRIAEFRRKLKPWMLPIAMLTGVLLHNWIGYVEFLSKYLIFIMLLITYCRLKPQEFRIGKYIWMLLGVQVLGAVAVYLAIRPINELWAEGAFICMFCPTATAAPVITGMLKGSVSRVVTYSLFSNMVVAVLGPLFLSCMSEVGGEMDGVNFATSLCVIAKTVLPLILGPLVIALLLGRFVPKAHKAIANHQGLSFYIWAFSLIIVVGNSVSFILREPASMVWDICMLGGISLVLCLLQFAVGRRIGACSGDAISGAQSLGQKNTVLAIWLALTYLNPIVSVAPATYVAWHNIVNSWQIYRSEKRKQTQL